MAGYTNSTSAYNQPLETSRASVSESVNGTIVSFKYQRDAVNGRENNYFGKIAKYGEAWSIGGTEPAIFSTDKDIYVSGALLKAGTYTFDIIPYAFSKNSPGEHTLWKLTFRKWGHNKEAGSIVTEIKTRAQIEDNSKEELEVFFDWREGKGTTARILFEYIEVHLFLSTSKDQTVPLMETPATVMNTIKNHEVKVSYNRLLENKEVFGGIIPYNQIWKTENQLILSNTIQIGGKPVETGIYNIAYLPHDSNIWEMHLTSVQNLNLTHKIRLGISKGEQSLPRLEYYFDRSEDGKKALIMVWGKHSIAAELIQ